jgi:hypothetical protein
MTNKFSKTNPIERVLDNMREAAINADSERVVVAAGELKSLWNFFRRTRSPFKNTDEVKELFKGHTPSAQNEILNRVLQEKTLEALSPTKRGVQNIGVGNFMPDDMKNPTKIHDSDTLRAMIESANFGQGRGQIGNLIQKIIGDNRLKQTLEKPLDPSIVVRVDNFNMNPKPVTMMELLTNPSAANLKRIDSQGHAVDYDQVELNKEVDKIATQFAEQYKDVAVFNYMKGLAYKAILAVIGLKAAAGIAIPAAAAATMGSPSSTDIQKSLNPSPTAPVSPNNTQTNSSSSGHPHMTNGNNFGSLGGIQSAPDMFGNDTFTNKVVDYSSMFRENSTNDLRISLAQSMIQEAPEEAKEYLASIPDVHQFVQNIISIINQHGGPESTKAIEHANQYVGTIADKTDLISKTI